MLACQETFVTLGDLACRDAVRDGFFIAVLQSFVGLHHAPTRTKGAQKYGPPYRRLCSRLNCALRKATAKIIGPMIFLLKLSVEVLHQFAGAVVLHGPL